MRQLLGSQRGYFEIASVTWPRIKFTLLLPTLLKVLLSMWSITDRARKGLKAIDHMLGVPNASRPQKCLALNLT